MSTHHTVIRASCLKAHLNIPFSMDTFKRFPTSYRQVPGPGPCSLHPYSGTLASLSSRISQHSLHPTWLSRNTAQSIQFCRYVLCPECPDHPSYTLFHVAISWIFSSLTLSLPFGTNTPPLRSRSPPCPWDRKLLHKDRVDGFTVVFQPTAHAGTY